MCIRNSFSKDRLNRDLTLDQFKYIHKQIPNLGKKCMGVYLYGIGEPFLNKHLPKILDYCKAHNIRTSTVFNASSLPSLEILNKYNFIIISIDSTKEDRFEHIGEKSDFLSVIGNLRKITEYKKEGLLKKQESQ